MELEAKGNTTGWPSGPTALLTSLTASSVRMQLAATLSHLLLIKIKVCVLDGNLFRFLNAIVATPGACI